LNLVVLGLSLSSSWGNGHATTYRGLLREFARRGHHVTFLERDVPWYRASRDMPEPSFCRLELYEDLEDLRTRFAGTVGEADVVIVGSYVPEGVEVGWWSCEVARGPVAFYDIDTPVTLAKLGVGDFEYLEPSLIGRYDAYFSFSGGPALEMLEREYGSPMARPLYCSFDPELYFPEDVEAEYDLGYMGTYSVDRQPPLEELLLEPARRWPEGRFAVAGPQYPEGIVWPANVRRIEHLPPSEHRGFYNRQRFTLNVTREDMIRAGYSPSVRLFEAAACGVPIVSDWWEGLDSFFEIGSEILVARDAAQTLGFLQEITEEERKAIGVAGRERVLRAHTAAHRAQELEAYLLEVAGNRHQVVAKSSSRRHLVVPSDYPTTI
jgi:spore maturation protein CgeB